MQFFNKIIPIDRVRNDPRLLASADAVLLGAFPSVAQVFTTTKTEGEEGLFSGILIVEAPSLGAANAWRRHHDKPLYGEDSKEVFYYAGNMYVYDINGMIRKRVELAIEDDRFPEAIRRLGIDSKKVTQMLGIEG